MTGWIWLVVVAVVLVCLLFGPIDARVRLEWPLRFDLRISWFSIPIPTGRRGGGTKKPKPPQVKPRKTTFRFFKALLRLRTGRAALAVARTPGLLRLARDLGTKAFRAIELVKADILLTTGLGDRKTAFWLAALLSGARPRVMAGQGRIKLELSPDFVTGGFGMDAEIILRTRPWPWLVLGARALCSPTVWRAWRTWKRERD